MTPHPTAPEREEGEPSDADKSRVAVLNIRAKFPDGRYLHTVEEAQQIIAALSQPQAATPEVEREARTLANNLLALGYISDNHIVSITMQIEAALRVVAQPQVASDWNRAIEAAAQAILDHGMYNGSATEHAKIIRALAAEPSTAMGDEQNVGGNPAAAVRPTGQEQRPVVTGERPAANASAPPTSATQPDAVAEVKDEN